MPLNVERIRELAADPESDLPDITDEQAEAVCRLLTSDAVDERPPLPSRSA